MTTLLIVFCVNVALYFCRGAYTAHRRSRRERALDMAGRLALPAPESEQCRRRRALLDASGRPDPTGMPDCGTGEGARWDAARVGWIRDRDGEFIPLEIASRRGSR